MDKPTFIERLRLLIGDEKPFKWAKSVGVDGATFNRVYNGPVIPKADFLEKIATGTGVSLNWLLTGKGPMFQTHDGQPAVVHHANERQERSPSASSESELDYPAKYQDIMRAVAEVLSSDDEGTKLALIQNALTFQKTVRSTEKIARLEADIEAIKRHFAPREAEPRETDFKTLGSKGER